MKSCEDEAQTTIYDLSVYTCFTLRTNPCEVKQWMPVKIDDVNVIYLFACVNVIYLFACENLLIEIFWQCYVYKYKFVSKCLHMRRRMLISTFLTRYTRIFDNRHFSHKNQWILFFLPITFFFFVNLFFFLSFFQYIQFVWYFLMNFIV